MTLPTHPGLSPNNEACDADQDPNNRVALQDALETLERAGYALAPDRPRARAIVVIRESAEHDETLMAGLIASSAGSFDYLPGADVVAALGINLLKNLGGAEYPTRTIRQGRATAVVLEVGGVFWVLSMYSAAKTNSKGENDFTLLLCKLILELRPHELCAVTFSRFVRSFQHGADLLTHVIRHVDVVRAGTTVMEMRGEKASQAMILWSTLAMISTAEREAILMRLTAGMVNKYGVHKKWVLGKNVCPPGFVVQDGHIHRLDEMQPLVHRMLELLADHSRPDWLIVQELSNLRVNGYRIETPKMRREAAKKLSDMHAASLVRGWLTWLPVLASGQFMYRVNNPFPGARRFSNMDVVGASETHPGVLEFAYTLGTPSGGWAPSEILIAAASRRHVKRDTGTGSAARRSPFVGFTWTTGSTAYGVTANRSRQYEIRATPVLDGAA